MAAPEPALDVDDAELFAAIDRYVSLLHAGDQSQAAELLAADPRLAQFAACLEALDGFAQITEGASTIVSADSETGLPTDGTRASSFERDFGRYELLEEVG